MIFTHSDDPEAGCDPTDPRAACCDRCRDAYLASGAEDQEADTCRCEPGARHPLCPHHGEDADADAQDRAITRRHLADVAAGL